MSDYRIFISYSDTGGGHKHAAAAIKKAIEETELKTPDKRKVEVISRTSIENSNFFNHLLVELYNYLLRSHPDWVRYYTNLIEAFKPNDNWLCYRLCRAAVKESFTAIQPAIVVSVHPMVNHYTARALKELGMAGKTKFVIVVTDPNESLWSGWACRDADMTFAPNDLARDRLISLGIESSRIRTIGMPVDPEFTRAAKVGKKELLEKLGLHPERLTILLCAGWAGSNAVLSIYRALRKVQKPVQAVIICGNNDKLLSDVKQLQTETGFDLPTAALAFSDSLSSLMSACDLLVTKGGGLTTFEAIARRLPMALELLTPAMPQESGTVRILIEAKLAKPILQPEDIVQIVESLDPLYDREAQKLPTEHNLDQVGAVFDIAEAVLNMLPQQLDSATPKLESTSHAAN